MGQTNKINGIQWCGIILSLIGGFFIAFPTAVGMLAIKFITILLMIIGFYGITTSYMLRSLTSSLVSTLLLIMSVYAFMNPEYILLVVGISFIVSGINGLLIYSRRRTDNLILSSTIMLLLGVFAVLNSKAALATVMTILGIVLLALGFVLIYSGKLVKPIKRHFEDFTHATKTTRNRVIINIDSDDVEEVDYKEY